MLPEILTVLFKHRVNLIIYPLREMFQFFRCQWYQGIALRVHNAGQRQIHQQHAKGNRQQQQRLKPFFHRKVDQHTGNADHDQVFPAARLKIK